MDETALYECVGELAVRMEHEQRLFGNLLRYGGCQQASGINPVTAILMEQMNTQKVGEVGVADDAAMPFRNDAAGQSYVLLVVLGRDYNVLLIRAFEVSHRCYTILHYLRCLLLALQPALPDVG